jgi:hypothetical protein
VCNRAKGERNILHTTKGRKVNWIGHILRRNCLLKHVIEGKTGKDRSDGKDEEDVINYCVTSRKRKLTGN